MIGRDIAGRALTIAALMTIAACQRAAPPTNTTTPAASPSIAASVAIPLPTPRAAASLGGYVGKYPFDKVDGVSFLDNPVVSEAVNRLVADPGIRAQVLGGDGPGTPIALHDGKLIAWGCRTHDCGDHNWAIKAAPDGSDAQVCYHDATTMQQRARWYAAAGKAELRPGDCPSS